MAAAATSSVSDRRRTDRPRQLADLLRQQGGGDEPHLRHAHSQAPEVQVNCVVPGLVETPWTATVSEEFARQNRAATPMGRAATADDELPPSSACSGACSLPAPPSPRRRCG